MTLLKNRDVLLREDAGERARRSPHEPRATVVGGGIFGCTMAIALADAGFDVVVVEAKTDILSGATKNNLNRVHFGYHYPRDLDTAIRSRIAFHDFVETFSECIHQSFPNYYFIADDARNKTSPEDFLTFCENAGIKYEIVFPKDVGTQITNCSMGIKANEVAYDHDLLRHRLMTDFASRSIRLECGHRITEARRTASGFSTRLTSDQWLESELLINCTYANINQLDSMLGVPIVENQYEYTLVPVIETTFEPMGLAVMDGPFTSLMPYGTKHKLSLIYHVEKAVIDRQVELQLDPTWADPTTSPLAELDRQEIYRDYIDACAEFLPELKNSRLEGFFEGPRMVLPNREKDDARPSLVRDHGDGFITIFSGKVDHSLGIAREVAKTMRARFYPEESLASPLNNLSSSNFSDNIPSAIVR